MPTPRPQARVVVLFHAAYRRRDLSNTAIHHLAPFWREDGVEVMYGFGTRRLPEADLAILHVDLSVVPAAYARLADRYPITLNARILDVRKSVCSRHLVSRDGAYDGPVLVKTDLNSAGRPERLVTPRLGRLARRLGGQMGMRRLTRVRRLEDYRVFDTLQEVPAAVWRDRRFVVEKYMPQKVEGGYAVHSAFVLGGVRACERWESPHPIVADSSTSGVFPAAIEPQLEAPCRALGLDFGKVDYTRHGGELAILDVNKTVGGAVSGTNPRLDARRRVWASGLHEFLDGRREPC